MQSNISSWFPNTCNCFLDRGLTKKYDWVLNASTQLCGQSVRMLRLVKNASKGSLNWAGLFKTPFVSLCLSWEVFYFFKAFFVSFTPLCLIRNTIHIYTEMIALKKKGMTTIFTKINILDSITSTVRTILSWLETQTKSCSDIVSEVSTLWGRYK